MTTNAQDVAPKLEVLLRLTALQVLGDRTGAEAITLLARAGLDNDLIADLVGTSPATVRATLSRARRTPGSVKSPKSESTDSNGSN